MEWSISQKQLFQILFKVSVKKSRAWNLCTLDSFSKSSMDLGVLLCVWMRFPNFLWEGAGFSLLALWESLYYSSTQGTYQDTPRRIGSLHCLTNERTMWKPPILAFWHVLDWLGGECTLLQGFCLSCHVLSLFGGGPSEQNPFFAYHAGRTHRSNQVTAPEYVFLISELAGEQRFASIVAKRLESLVRELLYCSSLKSAV